MLKLLFVLSFSIVLAEDNSTSRPDIYGLVNILYVKADANFDGTITEPELANVFHGFDKNADGRVTEAEFIDIWMSVTGQPAELSKAYFHLADLTDDAIIDDHDLAPLYRVFDLNGDGKVSSHEFAQKWEDIIRESPFAVLFERSDTNTDEFLSHSEFDGFFSSFDNNGDGHISNQEFDAGWTKSDFALLSDDDDLFSALDSNHDKMLTNTDTAHLFTRYDNNADSKLSILEVVQMKSLLRLQSQVGPSGK